MELPISRATPKQEPTDRATAAALLSAFGSDVVRARHRRWCTAVNALTLEIERLIWNREQDQDPYGATDVSVGGLP